MRAVILMSRQANQVALVHKMSLVCDVVGVVLSRNIPRRPPPRRARRFLNRVAGRTVGRPLTMAWLDMLARYEESWPALPEALPAVQVSNVNDAAALDLVRRSDADLAIVSGTNLVAPATIEALSGRTRFVNLHTGISPYVRGGPNCTNWCLARGWFHLIGSSVMWLDAGIDSGDLIATERAPLTAEESYAELQWAVMEHAHELYVRSVARLARGDAVPRIPQATLGAGETFYTAQWTASQMLRARWNFARGYEPALSAKTEHRPPRLVGLDDAG